MAQSNEKQSGDQGKEHEGKGTKGTQHEKGHTKEEKGGSKNK